MRTILMLITYIFSLVFCIQSFGDEVDQMDCGGQDTSLARTITWPEWTDNLVSYSLYSYDNVFSNFNREIFGLTTNSFEYIFDSYGGDGMFEVVATYMNNDKLDSIPIATCAYQVEYPVPVLNSPACSSLDIDTLVGLSFSWDSELSLYTNADYHQLEIRESNTKAQIGNYFRIPENSIRVYNMNLLPDTEYEWRVRVTSDDYGVSSDWTEYCSFTTAPWLSVEEPGQDQGFTITQVEGVITVSSLRLVRNLQLFDLNGRKVVQSQSTNLSTHTLSPGIYFLLVNGEEMVKVILN